MELLQAWWRARLTVPSGASWVKNLPQLNGSDVKSLDINQVARLQNIAGVDDMVGKLVQRLKDHNLLDNTYVIYTTDNGFHIGNHRLLPGKRCPYEEDVNIPLVIRGPGVPSGMTTEITNSHTDMAPTILQMLGVPPRDDFDGAPLAYTQDMINNNGKHQHVNVEFWDGGTAFKPNGYRNSKNLYYDNVYKALRLVAGDYSFYYAVWCNGEHEFYNMNVSQYTHPPSNQAQVSIH